MSDPEPESIKTIKATLEPYIKPREQISYIRRVLALHLQHQCGTDDLHAPLSLLDNADQIQQKPQWQSQGVFNDYLREVQDNMKARQELSDLVQQSARPPSPKTSQKDGADPIAQHIALIKLRKKNDNLLTTQKYLDLLASQPAASQQDFFDLEKLFKDSPTLPEVPREVVDGFTTTTTAADGTPADLPGLLDKMDKALLRNKLLLHREKQLLKQVKARTATTTNNVTNEARRHALNTTRNKLINWIESELSKASSADGADEAAEEDGITAIKSPSQVAAGSDMSEQLAEVTEKYKQYVASRRSILELLSRKPHPTLKPSVFQPAAASEAATEEAPGPVAHLMIPDLEKLLHLSRQQKGWIQHKSHLTAALSKRVKETKQVLDHLAEESQLLPSYPMPGSKRAKGSFGDEMAAAAAAADKPDSADYVKPWVFAADSAKVATLEAVAEKVEEGQVALEGSMKVLQDVDQLLGREPSGSEDDDFQEQLEEDLWLTGEPDTKMGQRKHLERIKSKQTVTDDPWSVLDGNLGLIGQDSPAR